ncbi:Response regulator receiver domain-containing protein [Desulfatibacillum alkenivorans DSM 16219]|uniref:Response regulator receiver domain-containing protein n=1 Tax=Desulfatibacillum alkenivorans DSM 16219 TaxID=1121393 RepID=A0A1M6TID8_9BACT|nr:response regulator [Desulfatibacillum alkenivorans]SHK56679.1 Response regulator receiver domain-containing protein [Desulfatibacillum alkenivorans DSM 16219]
MITMPVQESAGFAPSCENRRIKKAAGLAALLQEASRTGQQQEEVQCILDVQESLWECSVPEERLQKVFSQVFQAAGEHAPVGGRIYARLGNAAISNAEAEAAGLAPGAYVKVSITNSGFNMDCPENLTAETDALCGLTHRSGPNGEVAFFLPAVRSEAPAPKPEIEEKQRILIMDDDEAVCEIAVQMLKFLGYESAVSMNGDEAVAVYKEAQEQGRPFAAVILDLTVPDGPGAEETIKRLEALDPNVTALISSGYFDEPAVAQFQDYGFSGAIIKPFRLKALGAVIKAALTGEMG